MSLVTHWLLASDGISAVMGFCTPLKTNFYINVNVNKQLVVWLLPFLVPVPDGKWEIGLLESWPPRKLFSEETGLLENWPPEHLFGWENGLLKFICHDNE